MSNRAPAYRDPALHFDALRLAALREVDRSEKTLATKNEGKVHVRAPAQVHSAHAALCCWSELSAHSQPALRTGLMAPALASCSMYLPGRLMWEVILELNRRADHAQMDRYFSQRY